MTDIPETVLFVVGAVIAVATFMVMVAAVIFLLKLVSKAQASSVQSLARSATARGWQFEHNSKIGDIRCKWSGSTDGLAWSASHTSIENNSGDNSQWSHTFRWRAGLESGPSAPLMLIHERSKLGGVDEKLQQLPGFLRGLASKAIDHVPSVYFGPEAADLDLSAWVVVKGHKIPAMRVMAPVDDARASILVGQVGPSVINESAALAAGGEPPVILIQPDAVHLATRSGVSDADVERAVRLGVSIAKSVVPW